MEEENKQDESSLNEKILKKVEEAINNIEKKGLQTDNLDNLGKLIDIQKDLKNQEYWNVKEEYYMRLRGYEDESYGRRGVRGTGRYSMYRGDDSYGRRGVPGTGRGRYRGHDVMDDMYDHYDRYANNKEEYRRGGHYGAKEESTESLENMMKATYELICVMSEDADSPEEMEIIKKYSRKISEL